MYVYNIKTVEKALDTNGTKWCPRVSTAMADWTWHGLFGFVQMSSEEFIWVPLSPDEFWWVLMSSNEVRSNCNVEQVMTYDLWSILKTITLF